MSSDARLMWPSTYDPITDTHTMCVGYGLDKKLFRFTSEEWNDTTFMSTYTFGWTDPRSFTTLTASSSPWFVIKPLSKLETGMNPFLDKVERIEYVGSRVTCSPPPTDTDEDVLLLTDDLETLIGDCIEVGFTRDGDHKASYPVGFVSLRSGTMNFIVTDNEEFFEKFMLATHVCKSLNVMSKTDRICVFQAILYGKEYGGFITMSKEETPF